MIQRIDVWPWSDFWSAHSRREYLEYLPDTSWYITEPFSSYKIPPSCIFHSNGWSVRTNDYIYDLKRLSNLRYGQGMMLLVLSFSKQQLKHFKPLLLLWWYMVLFITLLNRWDFPFVRNDSTYLFSPRFTDNRMTRCHHGLPFLCKKGSWPLTSLWSRWIHCHCIPSPTFLQPQQQQQIEFWDCPSKARWHLHAIVDDDAKSTNLPSTPSQFTLLDALGDKSSKACTDQWIATFNHRHNKGHNSYSLESTKKKCIQPSFIKGRGMAQSYWVLSFALC